MYKLFFLFSSLSLLVSCKFNPNLQGRGELFLQGEWAEDSVLYQDKLLEYTQHQFTFTCDSFYATLNTVAKINRNTEECYNNGKWTEYAKGRYALRNDTLYLVGTFTKSNFKQKTSGCYRTGQYLPIFVVKNQSSEKIYLEAIYSHLPITLKLKKRIICNPKPL